LNVDLREGVFITIARRYQTVVRADRPKNQDRRDRRDNDSNERAGADRKQTQTHLISSLVIFATKTFRFCRRTSVFSRPYRSLPNRIGRRRREAVARFAFIFILGERKRWVKLNRPTRLKKT
jgi:hypothetical protein